MSKPIIPMHSPVLQRGRCHALCSCHFLAPRWMPSVTVYNARGIPRIPWPTILPGAARRVAPMSEVTITVRGEHETRVAPEEAVARVSVRAEGPQRGDVVERIGALTTPLRDDLTARKDAGGLTDWSSQRVSVWANRPWNNEGKQLALVHYAS